MTPPSAPPFSDRQAHVKRLPPVLVALLSAIVGVALGVAILVVLRVAR